MGARSGRKKKKNSKSQMRIKSKAEARYKRYKKGISQEGLNVLK